MVALVSLALVVALLWYFGERAMGGIWSTLDRSPRMRPFAWLILAPGVATHESAHALAALGCGAGVHKFVPFRPERTETGWQFGYVQPGRTTTVNSGIIALAPLWLTPLLVYGVASLMTGHSGLAVWQHLQWGSPLTWLWFWWLVSVSMANMPSRPDLRIAAPLIGVLAVSIIGVAAAIMLHKLQWDPTSAASAALLLLAPQTVLVFILASLANR